MAFRPAVLAAFGIVYGTGVYAGMLVQSVYKLPEPPADISDPKTQKHLGTSTWDKMADHFDSDIKVSEFFLGLSSMRRYLISKAHGDVLEISAGTGRNTKFYTYNSKVKSLTFIDSSLGMLNVAYETYTNILKGLHGSAAANVPEAKFKTMIAENLEYDDNSFDTVIDTFGLCSVDDPVKVLTEMNRVCKPDGTILLLEHGRTYTWNWLTMALDRTASEHNEKWGCWWNRDIPKLVKESGLIVLEEKQHHLGTTHWIVARPNKLLDNASGTVSSKPYSWSSWFIPSFLKSN